MEWTKKETIEIGRMVRKIQTSISDADTMLCSLNDYILSKNPTATPLNMDEVLNIK